MRSESSGYGGYAAPSSWVQPVPTVLTSPQGSPQARWEKVGKGGKRWKDAEKMDLKIHLCSKIPQVEIPGISAMSSPLR